MKRSRFSEEQVTYALRQAESGTSTKALMRSRRCCRCPGTSPRRGFGSTPPMLRLGTSRGSGR